jgi:alpha-galactosidase
VPEHVDACVSLQTEGVSVMVDITDGRLPALVHWGAELGDHAHADAVALIEAGVPPGGPNLVDEPVRLSLLPEHWTGWVGRPGITGSRAGRAWSPQFTTTSLSLNGQVPEGASDPRLVVHNGPALLEVGARDETAQLDLTIRLELTTGGLLRSQVELTNLGAEYTLNDCVLAYPVPPAARELLDLAGRWGKERIPQRQPWRIGVHLREGRKGRTGADAATLLHAGEPGFTFGRGEIWAVHVGWSGNHTHYAERVSSGEQVIGGGELLLPGEIVLGPGEAYTSPWLYGSYGVGLDEVAQRFHRYLRSRPTHPSAARPVTINVWEAVYFDHDLDRLTELAKAAARVGIERYVLDDGWFGQRRDDTAGLGDWTVSPDVWPHGLHPLVDTVKELGMEFGLWFEPEMVNLDSDVARAHPEWVMGPGGRLPVESRNQQVINLGIPECYAYIRDAILAILAEYEIDYIKWDHNRDLIDAGTQPDGRPGVHEQTLAFYRLLDEIRSAHPRLEIESCSSGGARVDLGVLERTDRVWVSDCIDPLERQLMHRWTAQLIPPELMGAHIASAQSHTTGRYHELNFRASTAIFGHLGVEWDLTNAGPRELDELTEWIALFKKHRDMLLTGTVLRADFPDETVAIGGVVSTDLSTAIYSLTSLARSEVTLLGRIRLPGLDPNRRYRVTPVMLDFPPSGLVPPLWWGVTQVGGDPYEQRASHAPSRFAASGTPGVVLSGAALAAVGLSAPIVDPEHTILYLAEAIG